MSSNINVSGDAERPLVLVISPSPVYRDTLFAYLRDLNYRVSGPFENVDAGHASLRRDRPDLIIFDALNSQSELISYSSLLKSEGEDLPTLVIHNGEGFSVSHTIIDFIFPPINPIDLEKKLSKFLGEPELESSDELQFIRFMNATFESLIEMAPEYGKKDIEQITRETILELTLRNSELTRTSEEAMLLQVHNIEAVDLKSLKQHFKILLDEVIIQIDDRMEADWGASLVEDTLEKVTISLRSLPEAAISIVEDLGKGYDIVLKKFKHAVPDYESLDKNLIVVKLILSDIGPEIKEMYATAPEFRDEFDVGVASQLITLVGQGSNYHQGIFGPIPIPKTKDIIAILWSKMLKSDIKDIRMAGKTLVVLAIGFHQELINLVPSRERLEMIFSDLNNLEHENEINSLILEKIAEKFRGNLL